MISQFIYELFLDDKGEKISKTKGNGIAIEEWLRYASPESLALYMFQKPRTAKRLYFDVIPKAVDEYYTFLGKWKFEKRKEKSMNFGGNGREFFRFLIVLFHYQFLPPQSEQLR